MFDNSFSISVFFPQAEIRHKAHILNAECPRRIDKSNKHEVRIPKMTDNEKKLKFSKKIKFSKTSNARFSVSNNISFSQRKIHTTNKSFSKIQKPKFTKKIKMRKDTQSSKSETFKKHAGSQSLE